LKTIYEYKIAAEQRNKKGETTTDITGRYTGKELEIAIFSIVSNQFEHKLENKGEILLKKVVDLNPNLAEKAIEYKDTLQRVHNLYSSSDNGLAIENWTAKQVKDWEIKFKANFSEQNNRPLAEFASAEEFKGVTERRTASYSSVREDSSAGATNKLPAEVAFCKRSIIPKVI
jgi:RPE1 domain-containing protein